MGSQMGRPLVRDTLVIPNPNVTARNQPPCWDTLAIQDISGHLKDLGRNYVKMNTLIIQLKVTNYWYLYAPKRNTVVIPDKGLSPNKLLLRQRRKT